MFRPFSAMPEPEVALLVIELLRLSDPPVTETGPCEVNAPPSVTLPVPASMVTAVGAAVPPTAPLRVIDLLVVDTVKP